MSTKTIIEVNGVKLEVDLRTARRIDELKIGSPVKCLVKQYTDYKVCPGVIVGFVPFKNKPSIVVAYLDTTYSSADLKFVTFNEDTRDFEIVADIDYNSMELDKGNVLRLMDKDITKKEQELQDLIAKKKFFLENFDSFNRVEIKPEVEELL